MQNLIECVPNFSEGRDLDAIRQITDAIESVEGVSLLDVDPGASTKGSLKKSSNQNGNRISDRRFSMRNGAGP